MRIFDYFFNRYGIPLLVVGSTGTGIKLYFGKVGYLTSGNSEIFSSLEGLEQLDNFQADQPQDIGEQPKAPAELPPPVKQPEPSVPEIVTFAKKISGTGFKLINENTSDDVIRNIMFQRLYPNKDDAFSYRADQLFKGSISFSFKTKNFESKHKKHLKTISKPDNKQVNDFKQSCLAALKIEYTNDKDGNNQLSRLREWCTEPKVKDVLSRHKFKVFSDPKHDKQVEAGIRKILAGWFKKEKNHKWWEKQSFFSKDEIKQILNGKESVGIKNEKEVTVNQIRIVKDKCLKELDKNFERENFYLTKDFIDQMNNKSSLKVDAFQEVAIFCSVPTEAKDYVKDAMQGVLRNHFDSKIKNDYCYVNGKQPAYYAKVSTADPFEGKTFWCAVRLLYETKPKKP
ncbi:hypothetical protein [Candidatus Mycoplasma haematohominis]|uniref:hypothetical protein n=1 Tax=Candidatus Mycoplasma haematohominis TaxID=1494318 RepID=UPI001C0A7371|nr:hypothetical protein [Candidatus Mycoplasma haemohominis]